MADGVAFDETDTGERPAPSAGFGGGTPGSGGLEHSVARVHGNAGAVVGTAFQVGPRQLLTCAHVVERALGVAVDLAAAVPGPVLVEFPLLPDEHDSPVALTARVTGWVPARDDDTGDIAVLTLDSDPPLSARPARLVAREDLWGHPCRVFGFPAAHRHGVWVSGVLRARQAAGWVQLESSQVTGYAVEAGFSGAPVWDDDFGAVVGMAVAAEVRGDLRAAYMIPTAQLAQAYPDLAEVISAPCPYRGLAAFRQDDAEVFFGRAGLTERLAGELARRRFVAVVGPSGSGKSSLVFAGLLPLVHRRPEWATATMRPAQASSGVAALAAALLPVLEPDQNETERLAGLPRLATVLREGCVRDVVARCVDRSGANRLLLIIDQFEEVFTSQRADAAELIDILLSALHDDATGRPSGLTVLITLRTDFLDPALQNAVLAGVLQESVTAVGQMDRAQLRTAIEGPLPAGIGYEPGLVDRILDDVGDEPGSLPLLEFALTLLWERQDNGRLTHASYQELGGVEGALARYAERVFQQQVAPEDREECRRLLVQLVRPTETGEPVRRVARRAELGEARWRLGQRLAATRLVVADRDATGAETLELVHEALIGGWARLRDWAGQDREFRAWQEGLRSDVAAWETLGRDPGALLRGMPLAEAVRWLGERPEDVPDAERQYIRNSSLFEGRSIRRLRTVVAALALLVLVASGLGVMAVRKAREAGQQARESEASYLVSQAQVAYDGINDRGKQLMLQLSAAAYHFSDSDQATANLTKVATRNRYVSHLLPTDGTGALAYNPSQPDMLAVTENGQLALWDVMRKRRLTSTPFDGLTIDSQIAFALGGDAVVFTENRQQQGSRVRLWRYATGELKSLWGDSASESPLGGLQVSPDGKRLAVCAADGFHVWSLSPLTQVAFVPRKNDINECAFALLGRSGDLIFADRLDLVTWGVSDGRERSRVRVPVPGGTSAPTPGEPQRITGLSIAPDGRTAAVTGPGGLVWWDLRRRTPLPGYGTGPMEQREQPSFSADGRRAFLPDGHLIDMTTRHLVKVVPSEAGSRSERAVLNADGSTVAHGSGGAVEIIRLADFDALPLPDVRRLAMWPDGTHLTTVGDTDVSTWSLLQPRRSPRSSAPLSRTSEGLLDDLSRNGAVYVRVDSRQRIQTWDMTGQRPRSRALTGDWHHLRALSVDQAGTVVAAADESHAYVLKVADGKTIASVRLPDGFFASSVSVSPAGRYLAVTDVSYRKTVLWDVSTTTPAVLPIPSAVGSPVFSPNGQWAAFTGADAVIVWDLGRRAEFRRFSGTGVIAFSPSSDMIAVDGQRGVSDDGNPLDVRALTDGRLVTSTNAYGGENAVFTADGHRLATADQDALVDYPLDAAWALKHVCDLVGRSMTRQEWSTYAQGFPYAKTCP